MNISSRGPTASPHFNEKSQSFSQYFKVSDPCRKVSVNKNKFIAKVKSVHHTCEQWCDGMEQIIVWMCTELIYSTLWPCSAPQRVGSVDDAFCPKTRSNTECDKHYVESTTVCLHLAVTLVTVVAIHFLLTYNQTWYAVYLHIKITNSWLGVHLIFSWNIMQPVNSDDD